MKIAFYAPMKSPKHPTPSGDRLIARLFFKALRSTGADVELASELRSYEGLGDANHQRELHHAADAEAADIIERYRKSAAPDVWFSYHVYHKAPDWIGPQVSQTLGSNYVIAEASYAPKQLGGPWAAGLRQTERCIALADRILVQNPVDSQCLMPHVKQPHVICGFPIFLDFDPIDESIGHARRTHPNQARVQTSRRYGLQSRRPWIIAVAMMRRGDKLASYRLLADAMSRLNHREFQLIIVGDGEARDEVESTFARFEDDTVIFTGRLAAGDLYALLDHCAVHIWPAVNEAIGMALLESLAVGVPVISGDEGAISQFVDNEVNGMLIGERNPNDFAAALDSLLADQPRRRAMGAAARRLARQRNGLAAAARRLCELIDDLYSNR